MHRAPMRLALIAGDGLAAERDHRSSLYVFQGVSVHTTCSTYI